jgi:hypothetical protein
MKSSITSNESDDVLATLEHIKPQAFSMLFEIVNESQKESEELLRPREYME